MANFTDLPRDVTANVIESYADPLDIIQRRRLGAEWYTRYLQLLPSLTSDLTYLEYGLEVKDESFIIDLLALTQGDLFDHPDLGPNLRTDTLEWLDRFAKAEFSQDFGRQLARLPIFAVNLAMTLDQIFANIHRQRELAVRHGPNNFFHELTNHLVAILNDMLYFDSIVKVVFLPWVRRHPERLTLLFIHNDNNDLIKRLLVLFQQHRIELHSEDLNDIGNNPDLNPENTQLINDYPWTE